MLDNEYDITDFENNALRKSRFAQIPKKNQQTSIERLFEANGGIIFLTKPRGRNVFSAKVDYDSNLLSRKLRNIRRGDNADSKTRFGVNFQLNPKKVFDFADLVT